MRKLIAWGGVAFLVMQSSFAAAALTPPAEVDVPTQAEEFEPQIVEPYNILPGMMELDLAPAVNPHEWMDTVVVHRLRQTRSHRLTEDDFRQVAEELGIEVAAIKAVVDIEAGRSHHGFDESGRPLVNFDLSIYRQMAPRHGVNLSAVRRSHPEVFSAPDIRRYGSRQAAQYARMEAASGVDRKSVLESTFWGMFQIGGFNWRKCGCDSVEQFVELMSRSERDQLELFARFIQHGGMVDAIRNRNWLKFAMVYNGPNARARGYHTRLEAAYRRYKKAEKES